MSITESIHHYNVGTLITISTEKLKLAQVVLKEKISFMRDVAKQASVAPQVYEDIRKYEAVHEAIAKLIEKRVEVGEAKKPVFTAPAPRQFPADYTII